MSLLCLGQAVKAIHMTSTHVTSEMDRSSATPLLRARRIAVKVGSALLVDAEHGQVNRSWLETLASDIAVLRARGQEVLLISSGAIALGRQHLGLPRGRLRLEEK